MSELRNEIMLLSFKLSDGEVRVDTPLRLIAMKEELSCLLARNPQVAIDAEDA